jgi:hypothetical protein
MRRTIGLLSLALIFSAACAGSGGELNIEESELARSGVRRDWAAHPAVIEIDEADEVYAVSDPHGGYVALGELLQNNGLISGFVPDTSKYDRIKWTGGTSVLVVAGDLIDKGPDSLGVIDLLRVIESKAGAGGGRAVSTMGNHEAEFLADPMNDKAMSTGEDKTGINEGLRAEGIDPKDMAKGIDAKGRGAWLRDLPFAVRIKKWFFAHGGNTEGRSVKELSKDLEDSVRSKGFAAKDVIGDKSILEAQEWYGNPRSGSTGKRYAEALGVKHIVFGHDPSAFGERGEITSAQDGCLFKLNVNMGLHVSDANTGGQILHVHTRGTDTAESLDARGNKRSLL